jgi:hypothetical protein
MNFDVKKFIVENAPSLRTKRKENLDVCTFDSMDLEAVTLRFMLKKLTSRSHGCFLSLHVSIF